MDENTLRQLVAQFWQLDPAAVAEDLAFNEATIRTMSSIRFYRFVAAVEGNLGVRLSDPAAITTYGALRRAVGLGAAESVPAPVTNGHVALAPRALQSAVATPAPDAPAPAAAVHDLGVAPTAVALTAVAPTAVALTAVAPPFSLGHDMEEVANLPEVAGDYAAHPFYANAFTRGEITWCAQFADPRPHFAVRFCAKEALRKCGDLFLGVPFGAMEIVNDAAGKPNLVVHDDRVRGALEGAAIHVSLTHTERTASAVVAVVRLG
jgi:holo-[acyl-carrier protein] synthase